jgi:CheY-like chemotaxis protein
MYQCHCLDVSFFLARNLRWIAGFLGETTFRINILQVSTVMSAAAILVHPWSWGQEPMPGKILIVDDYAPNRELIREALTDSPYEISEAVTASEALERLRGHKTDLVITDVRMPGLSGVELLKRLKKEYPDIVVILMSAFATVDGAVETMKFG